MSYCNPSEILSAAPREKLVKRLNLADGEEVNAAKVQPYIDTADGIINGRLGGLYPIPITGTDSLLIIKEISIGLALADIFNVNAEGNIPEKVKERSAKALETLDMYSIMQGDTRPRMTLPDAGYRLKARITAPEKTAFENYY